VPVERRARLAVLVLDEAHLLREEVGTLDAQFETHYLECARELSGRYPLAIVSTATIAQAEEHCRQLGLGEARIFPSRRRENHSVYYREDQTQVQHAVISLMPRGRAIAWALPHLLRQYLDVRDASPEDCIHLRPALVYCGTYTTRDQILAAIRRQVDPERPRQTEIGEFSRRYFDRAGIRQVLEQLNRYDIIVSTNIAAVGIDLGDLNLVFYFGMPKNVNEFIQSMNRTGRRQSAFVCIVHNPYLERDAAFYAYMRAFLAQPEALVEAVPLNRYARRAIEHTFSSVAIGQIQHVWGQRPLPDGTDLRRARRYREFRGTGFREARGTLLQENQVKALLQRTYRSAEDPSRAYPGLVEGEWDGLASSVVNYTPRGRGAPDFPWGDNWVSCADGVRKPMYQLRLPEPLGRLEFTPDAERLARANVRAIYASDRDESINPRDDEGDVVDGALADPTPTPEEPGD